MVKNNTYDIIIGEQDTNNIAKKIEYLEKTEVYNNEILTNMGSNC